jgi:hypothetical protein
MKDINREICLILTGTINVHGVAFMERDDTAIRYEDYKEKILKWIKNTHLNNIIFVENSGYDLTELKEIVTAANNTEKNIEYISYFGQDFPRELGKGYGEMQALKTAISQSNSLKYCEKFIKVNGRYFVPNISIFTNEIVDKNLDIMCDFSKKLTIADSRVFGGSKYFIENYLFAEHEMINDTYGVFFEHALARASLKSIIDNLSWGPMPGVPYFDGVSGTSNRKYNQNIFRQLAKKLYFQIKRKVYIR